MSTQMAWVTAVGIIAGTISVLSVVYLAGRDLKVFGPPQCMGIMGRLRGHKYYSKETSYIKYYSMETSYIQHNCLRCGKPKGK